MKTVLIADDHPIMLSGIESLIASAHYPVVGRITDGAEVMAAVDALRPAIVLLDVSMPGMTGIEILRKMREQESPAKVVLLTAQLSEDQLIEALRLGIRGFVLKEMATKLLVEALRRVNAGGQWLEKDSAGRAMAKLVRQEARSREIATLLTPREIEVVGMVAKGISNREIGSQLCIAEGTVKIHLHNIYEKLKINRRAELIRFAEEYGIT